MARQGATWERLTERLRDHTGHQLTIDFAEVERIIGHELPASARKHAAFWSNTSSYACAWTDAGFELTRRGLPPETVRFVRRREAAPPPTAARTSGGTPARTPTVSEARMPDGQEPSGSSREHLARAASHLRSAYRAWRNRNRPPPTGTGSTVDKQPDTSEFGLVGCVKSKLSHAAPAKDLYTSPLFLGAKSVAEASGSPWFILSAQHGLLRPDEVIEPYDLYLADMPAAYRQQWGDRVVARLTHEVGDVAGRRIDVHASRAYVEAIRPELERSGAVLVEPLAGLTMGERLAWYASRRTQADAPEGDRPKPAPIATTAAPARQSNLFARDEDRDRAVVGAILSYRRANVDTRTRPEFAETQAATDLIYHDPFAFLLGVIFDEGIVAERAWRAPYELRTRLGTLDPHRMRHMSNEIAAAVAQRPMLHRYRSVMAIATVRAAAKVCDEYGGDASRIWAAGSSAREVDRRLLAFHQIGQKKADMAVELLVSAMGVELADMQASDVAYDVHVRRVFLRAGLADRDTGDAIRAAARRLHPERPGELDLPTWFVGRLWCRPTDPDHDGCPLGQVLPRLTDRASTVR